jgi:hypothetical protein
MASVFGITVVPDKYKTEDGSATIKVTVTNTTSRPIRGMAKVRPLGNTEAAWLKIEGESERDFSAGGTDTYTVGFKKPKPSPPPTVSQPAQSFTFRFDEFSATSPNEDFTEGPIITVEIPEVVITDGGGTKWWLYAIIAAVVLIVGIVVTFLLLRNKDPETPPPTPTPTATPTTTPTTMPTLVPALPKMSEIEIGFDRPGSDFNLSTVPTAQTCEKACQENSECLAYTFGIKNHGCWLKKRPVPNRVSNPDYASGTKLLKKKPDFLDKSSEKSVDSNK